MEGCPSPCFLRAKGGGLYLKELCPTKLLHKEILTYMPFSTLKYKNNRKKNHLREMVWWSNDQSLSSEVPCSHPSSLLVNFDLFKAKIQDKNSKEPGDTCRGPKGALAQWYGRLIGCPCFRQVSDRFKSHAHGTRRTIVEGCPSPCFLRAKGGGLYLK